MKRKVVSLGEKKLILQLDKILGNPNYRKEQFFCPYIGLQPQFDSLATFKKKIENLWWVKALENKQARKLLSQLLQVPVVSIWPKGENRVKSIDIIKKLRILFFQAVKNSSIINKKNNRELSMGELYDSKVTIDKEIKMPGYGSFQFGLLPNQVALLLGVSLNKLKTMKKLIIGIGGGDFVMYSLPGANNVLGVDVSQKMVDLTNHRNIPCVCGDVASSDLSFLPDKFLHPDLVVADYFLDIIKNPVTTIKKMAALLDAGGKLMIVNMIPIDQEGPGDLVIDSKISTAGINQKNLNNKYFKISPDQEIGNSHNPWEDILRLQLVCKNFNLVLKKFSVTTYALFDSGRSARPLPAELRPSGILVFEKVK